MEYWKTMAQGQLSHFKKQAIVMKEAVEKGEYEHFNMSLDVTLQAPVIFVYQNPFDKNSSYIQLDTGVLTIKS